MLPHINGHLRGLDTIKQQAISLEGCEMKEQVMINCTEKPGVVSCHK